MPTKWTFAQNYVSLWAIVLLIEATNASMFLPAISTYLSMLYLMRIFFPLHLIFFFSRCWIGCPSYTCAHIYFSLAISFVFITHGVSSSFTWFSPLCPTTSISVFSCVSLFLHMLTPLPHHLLPPPLFSRPRLNKQLAPLELYHLPIHLLLLFLLCVHTPWSLDYNTISLNQKCSLMVLSNILFLQLLL